MNEEEMAYLLQEMEDHLERAGLGMAAFVRSEERRVGKECW